MNRNGKLALAFHALFVAFTLAPLVVVMLNGLKVIDTDFSKLTKPIGKFSTPYAQLPLSGYITIQDHWKPLVWYRNIRIKPL